MGSWFCFYRITHFTDTKKNNPKQSFTSETLTHPLTDRTSRGMPPTALPLPLAHKSFEMHGDPVMFWQQSQRDMQSTAETFCSHSSFSIPLSISAHVSSHSLIGLNIQYLKFRKCDPSFLLTSKQHPTHLGSFNNFNLLSVHLKCKTYHTKLVSS